MRWTWAWILCVTQPEVNINKLHLLPTKLPTAQLETWRLARRARRQEGQI